VGRWDLLGIKSESRTEQDSGGTECTTKHAGDLEWPLEVTLCRFAEEVDGDRLGVVEVLQAHEGLDEKGLCVLEV
jgi:hypothetical protein